MNHCYCDLILFWIYSVISMKKIPYSVTPEEIAEYQTARFSARLLKLRLGLEIIAKVREIQEFYEKNGDQSANFDTTKE